MHHRTVERTHMTSFDIEYIKDKALRDKIVLTPVPDALTVNWSEECSYYFDEVYDGSSLLWVFVIQDTFEELIPGFYWTVDDPGSLYIDTYSDRGAGIPNEGAYLEASYVDMNRMQEAADLALARYKELFEALSETLKVAQA